MITKKKNVKLVDSQNGPTCFLFLLWWELTLTFMILYKPKMVDIWNEKGIDLEKKKKIKIKTLIYTHLYIYIYI